MEALLGGPPPVPILETPLSLLIAHLEGTVVGVPDAAGFRSADFGVVGFGELIVAD